MTDALTPVEITAGKLIAVSIESKLIHSSYNAGREEGEAGIPHYIFQVLDVGMDRESAVTVVADASYVSEPW